MLGPGSGITGPAFLFSVARGVWRNPTAGFWVQDGASVKQTQHILPSPKDQMWSGMLGCSAPDAVDALPNTECVSKGVDGWVEKAQDMETVAQAPSITYQKSF